MVRSIDEAIAWAENQSKFGPSVGGGGCQNASRTVYGVPSDGTPSAAADWAKSKHRVETTDPNAIPRGALVRWTGGSHGFGHVAISVGGGWCWSTDLGRVGYFNLVRIADVHVKWGLTLVGYTWDIDGVVVGPPQTPAKAPSSASKAPGGVSYGKNFDAALKAAQAAAKANKGQPRKVKAAKEIINAVESLKA